MLIILFRGSRNHQEVLELAGEVTSLDCPRTPAGAIRASIKLKKLLVGPAAVYSLMRASHLVIALTAIRLPTQTRYLGSVHQLPSEDAKGLVGRIEDVFVKHATRQFAFITAPSKRAVEELRDGGYTSPERALFEGNIIATSREPLRSPRALEEGPVRLLFAGRLTEQKGLGALPELLTEHVEPVSLRIVGDGPLREDLERIFRKVNNKHSVEFVGHSLDVTPHIDWADAIFLPSKWELNPQIVWESWSRGRPVIGSEIEVLLDLVHQGPMYTFETAADFANLLQNLVRYPNMRKSSFEAGPLAVATAQKESQIVWQLLRSA
ncbi:glycosyltransferase [Arthrobacter sp. NPDC092385]|uniref:glycosyltransferase n=1 Tax=Arthrobacter sp. NPDC092385 TaxID=3363943 RepID=UPI00382B94BF